MKRSRGKGRSSLPCAASILRISCEFNLNSVDSVYTVKEQNENEDECDLRGRTVSLGNYPDIAGSRTFMAYWILATSGLSEMKVKSPFFSL